MVRLSSLVEFERGSELLHKMDFANSCLQRTHRRKAKRFINGNSRQTIEAKDTSECKYFQMEASFSLHSPQFSFKGLLGGKLQTKVYYNHLPSFPSKEG